MLFNRPYFSNIPLPRATNPRPNLRISNRQFLAIRRGVSCISTLAFDLRFTRRTSTHRPVRQPVHTHPNAFVVGGGPAGLAAAISLRQKGFAVRVADGATPPIDKACGEGLMPDTVTALSRMGVHIPRQDSYPLRGIRFITGGVAITGNFSGGLGLGVRRTALQASIAAHAASVGVECLWNTPVIGIADGGVQVRDQIFAADWIIGADGSRSRTRKWAGLEESNKRVPRYAFRTHFRRAPWSEYVEIYWSDQAQAYITPVADNEVCLVVLSEQPNMRAGIIPALFPELAGRLPATQLIGTERGAVTTTHRLRQVFRDNIVLVGDASGSVDAITGEGLNLGFQHALALSECLPSGNLAEYQKIHRRLRFRPSVMAYFLSLLGRQKFIRERTFRAFESDPSLFSNFLELHLGHASRPQAALAATRLGWHFATC
jgi:menaquinone-9 beta-reductase